MMGRTHSVHAEPTTLGLKLAGWAFELDRGRVAARGRRRRDRDRQDLRAGRDVQPPRPRTSRPRSSAALGLHVDPVSTQIVQRDRHAALLAAIAIIGGSLERFATEVRNLQHTEIGELQEPFKAGQKGSSAMPHKRNPILSERIAGLARLLRGYAHTALEDQPLWHERDISHSSAERVILPDATIVLDYMLVRMTGLVEGLVVRSERMRENIERGLGLHASSRVLVALVEEAGCRARRPTRSSSAPRCGPPTSARRCATCWRSTRPSPSGCRWRELDACFDDAAFLRHVPEVIARLDRLADGVAARPRSRERRRCRMPADAFVRSGKVRDLYARRGRSARARRVGPDQRLRRRPADRDPRQGPGADRPVALLVRRDGRHRPEPPAARPPTDDPALRGRIMVCRPTTVLPIEAVVRGYLAGLGLEGLPGERARSAASACRPACARATACRSRSSRRRPRRRSASTTRTSTSTTMAGDRRRRPVAERVRDHALRALRATPRRSPSGPASCSPTRSSSSGSTRRPASCCSSTRC